MWASTTKSIAYPSYNMIDKKYLQMRSNLLGAAGLCPTEAKSIFGLDGIARQLGTSEDPDMYRTAASMLFKLSRPLVKLTASKSFPKDLDAARKIFDILLFIAATVSQGSKTLIEQGVCAEYASWKNLRAG